MAAPAAEGGDSELHIADSLARRHQRKGPGAARLLRRDDDAGASTTATEAAAHSAPTPPPPRATFGQTVLTLLSLQLGWGLWLLPHSFAALGWAPALALLLCLSVGSAWSASLLSRLRGAAPGAVLLGDVGALAGGPQARAAVYAVVYALDASRCAVLHLAAAQSLRHALGGGAPAAAAAAGAHTAPLPPPGRAALAAAALALPLAQARAPGRLAAFFGAGSAAQLAALGVVAYQMTTNPYPAPRRVAFEWRGAPGLQDQWVAAFNMVFGEERGGAEGGVGGHMRAKARGVR